MTIITMGCVFIFYLRNDCVGNDLADFEDLHRALDANV